MFLSVIVSQFTDDFIAFSRNRYFLQFLSKSTFLSSSENKNFCYLLFIYEQLAHLSPNAGSKKIEKLFQFLLSSQCSNGSSWAFVYVDSFPPFAAAYLIVELVWSVLLVHHSGKVNTLNEQSETNSYLYKASERNNI